jgi:hypothetical protein
MNALANTNMNRSPRRQTARRTTHSREYLEALESRQLMAVDLSGVVTAVPVTAPNASSQRIAIALTNSGTTVFKGSVVMDLYAIPEDSGFPILLNRVIRAGTIAADATRSFTISATLKPSLAAGSYRIAAVIDPADKIAETEETNNTAISDIFSITQRDVDLVAGFNSNLPSLTRVIAGTPGAGTVFMTVRNAGSAIVPAGANAQIRLIARPLNGNGPDLQVMKRAITINVGGLLPGQSRNIPVSIQFPRTAPIGAYVLIGGVDLASAVAESNENNNFAVSNSVVNVTTLNAVGDTNLPVRNTGGNSLTGISIGSFVPASNAGAATLTSGTISVTTAAPSSIGNPPLNAAGTTPTFSTSMVPSSLGFTTTSSIDTSLTSTLGAAPAPIAMTTLMTI